MAFSLLDFRDCFPWSLWRNRAEERSGTPTRAHALEMSQMNFSNLGGLFKLQSRTWYWDSYSLFQKTCFSAFLEIRWMVCSSHVLGGISYDLMHTLSNYGEMISRRVCLPYFLSCLKCWSMQADCTNVETLLFVSVNLWAQFFSNVFLTR